MSATEVANRAWKLIESGRGDLEGFTATLRRTELLACTVEWLTSEVEDRRRRATLSVERRVETPVKGARHPRPPAEDEVSLAREREFLGRVEARRERLDALARDVGAIVEAHASEIALLWSRDLLDSSIAMPDGTLTTWGDASIAQHRERMEMFAQNARAGIEGAARHRKAIADLEAGGERTLNGLVRSVAA